MVDLSVIASHSQNCWTPTLHGPHMATGQSRTKTTEQILPAILLPEREREVKFRCMSSTYSLQLGS